MSDELQQKEGGTGPARGRRLSSEARRAQLLDCALTVFARRGLGEGRHAEIAQEAAVAVPTVFVYFPTREALVDSVLDEVARFLTEMGEFLHAQVKPAHEILRDHLVTFTDSVEAHPEYARVWLDWSTAIREKVWDRYLQFEEGMIALVRRTLERGQREGTISHEADADDQARLLVGSAHMLAQMKFAGRPRDKVEHFIGTLMGAVLGHGV